MRLDQAVVREIHARLDIGQYIGQYVRLHKRGRDLVGLCPFHDEKTPSFHVHPDRGFFKCFGCGAGGDLIAFVRRIENLSFPEAVRILAAKAGIRLAEETPRAAQARTEREAVYEANRIAAEFYARMLRSDAGVEARAYCERRGLTAETIERFGLGYAPERWDALARELRRHGIAPEIAIKAGLLRQGQRGPYDFYRDRLMIPVRATTGEIVAFGGRALGNAEPKYLNTTTTPVYTKGDQLFGLDIARRAVAKDGPWKGTIIVVEGYLDCIALHQAGFETAVATLGTAFTERQAVLLKRLVTDVFLCFDGDAAGGAAAVKAVDVAAEQMEGAGLRVRVVLLPAGEDPDTFVRSHGAEAFANLLHQAPPALQFRLDWRLDRLRAGFDSPARVLPEAAEIVERLVPPIERHRWIAYAAQRLQVNPDDLRTNALFVQSRSTREHGGADAARGRRSQGRPAWYAAVPNVERTILSVALEAPALAAEYSERIPSHRFRDAAQRRLYERIVASARSGAMTTADLLAALDDDPEAREAAAAILGGVAGGIHRDDAERRAHLERIAEWLERRELQERYRELSARIDELIAAGHPIPEELRGELHALAARVKR